MNSLAEKHIGVLPTPVHVVTRTATGAQILRERRTASASCQEAQPS